MIVGEKFLGDTRVLLHGTGEKFFKSRLRDGNFVEPGTFLAPTFDYSGGLSNVVTALSRAESQFKDFPLVMVINGDLPVCWEEGSSEESVIVDSIPLGNILWKGSRLSLDNVDFRKGMEDFFDPNLRSQGTEKIAERAIEYFKNLGFKDLKLE